MTSEARRRAVQKYDAEHCVKKMLKLNKKTDADILAKFASVPNVQGYIKALVREDLKKN